jgi:predicted regulator of Ras-like GTPase activity (Roadblock/LC7/MglB family)
MARNSTEILRDVLDIPGVSAVIVVGKDGFVIESMGSTRSIDLDGLGAAAALIFNGAEKMCAQLELSRFNTLTLEYMDAMIMAAPVGDALLAMVAPDSKTLGMIRFQVKKLLLELDPMF